MKKELMILMAAAAMVGCEQSEREVTEPAGAERDTQMQSTPSSTDTNTLSDPSGASSGSQQDSSQQNQDSSSSGAGTSSSGTSSSGSGTPSNP